MEIDQRETTCPVWSALVIEGVQEITGLATFSGALDRIDPALRYMIETDMDSSTAVAEQGTYPALLQERRDRIADYLAAIKLTNHCTGDMPGCEHALPVSLFAKNLRVRYGELPPEAVVDIGNIDEELKNL